MMERPADELAPVEGALRGLLPRWGLSEAADLVLLNVSENITFRVHEAGSGRTLAFRVHRPDYHSEIEILSEFAWLTALGDEHIVQTAAHVPAVDGSLLCSLHDGGETRHVAAFAFLPGREPAPGADLEMWFGRLGALTAGLHMQSRRWVPPAWFRRKSWTYETILGAAPHWGHWRSALGLDEGGAGTIAKTQQVLRKQLEAYGTDPRRFGLIHADLRLANLLVDGADLRVIDFDDCGFGWFGFDFAAAVSFLEHEPYIPALKAAWLSGYREVAPLDEEDARAIDSFVMLRRIQLIAWIASHPEAPTAREMGVPYTMGTVRLAEAYLRSHS